MEVDPRAALKAFILNNVDQALSGGGDGFGSVALRDRLQADFQRSWLDALDEALERVVFHARDADTASGEAAIAETLLEQGANFIRLSRRRRLIEGAQGYDLLLEAVRSGDSDLVSALVRHQAEFCGLNSGSILRTLVEQDSPDLVGALLDETKTRVAVGGLYADAILDPPEREETVLHRIAGHLRSDEHLAHFLALGATPSRRDARGRLPSQCMLEEAARVQRLIATDARFDLFGLQRERIAVLQRAADTLAALEMRAHEGTHAALIKNLPIPPEMVRLVSRMSGLSHQPEPYFQVSEEIRRTRHKRK